ncbi:MAG: PDZ domain-containing protein [Vicinamibacteraceae bacterium]|nr:PDZ domain-containing protein [Vicinamibacteraceae bacterium]
MDAPRRRPALSRETRLLIVTIAVSAVMLLVLARFRFPSDNGPSPAAVAAPLERLAARATFEELAGIVGQLDRRLSGVTLAFRVAGAPSDRGSTREESPSYVPGLRVARDLALAQIGEGDRVQAVVGASDFTPVVVAADAVRGIALVRVPPADVTAPSLPSEGAGGWTSRYVAVVEATRGGTATRPVFLARTTPMLVPRWPQPLLETGRTLGASSGAFVFNIDGTWLGLLVADEAGGAIVPASALLQAVDDMQEGRVRVAGDVGVEVQSLTPAIRRATGASQGVVVSFVDPAGPANGHLRVGDVVDAIDGEPTYSPDTFRVRINRVDPGASVRVRVMRDRAMLELPIAVSTRAGSAAASSGVLGLQLRRVAGIGSEVVRVEARSVAALSGLREGDMITTAGSRTTPAPADLVQAWRAVAAGAGLLVGFERDGQHHVTALEKP